jgi:two-component system cell cycle sensor histidine kinase/response regulator CckA
MEPFAEVEALKQRIAALEDELRDKDRIAHQALRESEARLRLVMDGMPGLIAYVDRDFRYRFTNRRYTEWFLRPPSDFDGRTIAEAMGEEGFLMIRGHAERALRGETVTFECTFNYPDQPRHVRASYLPDLSPAGEVRGFFVHVEDFSGVDRARRQLTEAHEFLHALVDSSPLPIIVFDTSGNITLWNPASERVFGWRAEEVLGKPIPFIPDEKVEEHRAMRAQDLRGVGFSAREIRRRRKDGAPVDLHVSTAPLRDASGGLRAVMSVYLDITARKQAETALLQAAKLESLGVLAGGIAHDFNNLLTGILGSADFLLALVPPDSHLQPALQVIVQASTRASRLTRQMLAYSGRGQFVVEHLDLSVQVRQILILLEASIPKNVTLVLELEDGLPLIEADAGQLQQLVMNLILNASEAVPGTGQVTVKTGVTRLAKPKTTLTGEVPAGTYVCLEVIDTGTGMDEATLSRIFDPFFTTKFTGRGLGLAAALGIVRGHRGGIQVESSPGRGSHFTVLLPITDRPAAVAAPPEAAVNNSTNGTILIIDDEPIVLQTAKMALERRGYRVLTAQNGREGVELFSAVPGEISLVILDMTMPVMGGVEALSALHAADPRVRVLGSSGYSEQEALQQFGSGLAAFLQKPYTVRQLYECVAGALDR